MKNFLKVFSVFICMALLFAGCSKPVMKCTSPEDNPRHHYLKGMDLLEENKVGDATAKFDRAVYCDEKFSSAHSAMAIVEAMKASSQKTDGYRSVDIAKAMEHLKAAKKTSETPEDDFAYHLASMRVNMILKQAEWLDEVKDDYKDATKLKVDEKKLIYYNGKEAASYFMGAAYLDAREFQSARDKFGEVLSAKKDSKWNAFAESGWKKTDKIVRALAGITLGDVGKEIALKDSVKRGDMAALFVDELMLEKLFAGRIPVKSAVDKKQPDFIPADMLNNAFREEVKTMMKWEVRGLEPVYDNTTKAFLFKPDEPVSRKEFALVLEDVLLKITGDEGLSRAYFGHEKSPFPDVPATSAWYNAIMNITTRNMMETELSGEFRPNDNIDGAEAVLAIRVLRQRLNIN
ncbi:MAG: S-layer homology domain-containing protein [Deltaproteobacteria bacterium]|nr:S-layer homology domain-containing protein [Deltaproteobacteria bacterium]